VEVNAGQLRVVVQHALKVGCTIQDVWVVADRPVGAERACQRADRLVTVGAGGTGLLTQLNQEFGDRSLQVARSAALPQHGDSFGRQGSGDLGKCVPRNVGKPT
jgi:hypothetical protein